MWILRATVEEFNSIYFLSRHFGGLAIKSTCKATKGAVRCLRVLRRLVKC